jgi:PHD/YefM family antitoxin component YafN of YafNO toxin-antitoxin module
MKTIELTTASEPLSSYADDLGEEIIVLTRRRKPVAAIVSLKDVDRETLALSTSPVFWEIIDRSRAQFAAGKTLSFEEVKRRALPKRARSKPKRGN